MNQELSIKLLQKLMNLRYQKQPRLNIIKTRLLTRQIRYKEKINQDLRNRDNLSLNSYEKKRWSRQLSHNLINQNKIRNTRVVVFGVGGIGSNVLLGLVYSGVQNFKIIDFDIIRLSNLNRQTLYIPGDIGSLKVNKAKERLLEINPNINIEAINMKIDYPINLDVLKVNEKDYSKKVKELDDLIKWGDFCIISLDYLGAPYLINDLCVKNHKPFFWGVINHSLGEIYNYDPNYYTACIRCIFGPSSFIDKIQFLRYKTNKDHRMKGINVGSTVIVTGNIISEMIIHDICGIAKGSHGNFLIYDAYNYEIIKIPIKHETQCICQNYHLIK